MTGPTVTLALDGYRVWLAGEVLLRTPDKALANRCRKAGEQALRELQALSCRDQDQAFRDMETDSIEQVLEGLSWVQRNGSDRL